VLGISGGTVGSHLHRALEALRGELGPSRASRVVLDLSGVGK
jgi:DNA-directed RNA polymerase specialized sigma24 family protein